MWRTDVERDGRKSLKGMHEQLGPCPRRISLRMHFITDENNEEKRYTQGKKEVLFENHQDECGTDQGEPAGWLVRTKKKQQREGGGGGGGGKVKNAPLATSYLHKLSHCALGTGTIWPVSVWV